MASASFARPARMALSSSLCHNVILRPSNQALQYLRTLNAPSIPFAVSFVRYASHQAQGRANGPKNGAGRRLGAKKTGEQFVVPGNIIFRQRGTLWFPGENCAMGRDHTIYASEKGFVKYYKDPERHPTRKFIGVAFERDWVLPTAANAPRRRRFGMLAVPRAPEPIPVADDARAVVPLGGVAGEGQILAKGMTLEPSGQGAAMRPTFTLKNGTVLKMRSNYMFREDNWDIGRAAEKAGVKVREFKKGDRWLAWRKTTARKAKSAEMRSMLKGKGKGNKKKRVAK